MNIFQKKHFNKFQCRQKGPVLSRAEGFTIIELVISILVLSLGIIGIFTAFSMMTILSSDSSDRLTASYLAQEGIEVVRNIRDTNWLNMDSCVASGCTSLPTWVDNNLENCASGCEADYNSTNTFGSGTDYLNKDVNGFYNYTSTNGVQSKFKRKIIITQVNDVNGQEPDHIMKIVVQVSWDKKATILNSTILADTCDPKNCITVEGVLYDWYNYKPQ